MFPNTHDDVDAQLANLSARTMKIELNAELQKRPLTSAEQAEINSNTNEFFRLEHTPQRRLTAPMDLDDSPRQRITGGDRVGATRGSNGFTSMGEWGQAIVNAAKGRTDGRLMNVATSIGQEGVGADGGFAVPPDFRQEITNIVRGDASLMALCDQQTTSSNALTLPIDATSPHQTSGGVLATWEAEASTLTQSKPQLSQLECKLHKLSCLVPLSDELLEDSPALSQWLPTKVGEKFNAKLNSAIVGGSGVGQPLGLLNAAAKITVAAVGSQGAGTIVTKNVLSMLSRLAIGSRKTAVWIVNPEAEQQLQQLVMPGGTTAWPLYLPGGSLIGPPAATLLGIPVVVCEAASAVGTEGDIILADLKQFLIVTKAAGLRSDFSIHAFFDQGISAMRFSLRVGGQSLWPSAIARQNGSSTSSPIITLNSSRT